jgi:hypothetical protein
MPRLVGTGIRGKPEFWVGVSPRGDAGPQAVSSRLPIIFAEDGAEEVAYQAQAAKEV